MRGSARVESEWSVGCEKECQGGECEGEQRDYDSRSKVLA